MVVDQVLQCHLMQGLQELLVKAMQAAGAFKEQIQVVEEEEAQPLLEEMVLMELLAVPVSV